ncbi:MAG: hypothetical protein A3J97_15720 [Spirochaetes bacterium RIFOXYC1_FULL_54_7]|nr:MAG: hypothetical protein A3J97_15720 [Spirochaetes bacterium RIFOXYC1_FULL_54_7]
MSFGPRDGWYAMPAHRLSAALIGGYTLQNLVTVYGGGGIDFTPNKYGYSCLVILASSHFRRNSGSCITGRLFRLFPPLVVTEQIPI